MNDGGPAYPQPINLADGAYHDGMSLRDWFAGMAIGECIRTIRESGVPEVGQPAVCAKAACNIADALLAELDKQ